MVLVPTLVHAACPGPGARLGPWCLPWSWCPPWSMVPTLVHGACLGPWCLPWSWSQPWSALPPCDRLSPWDGTLGSVLSEAQLREEPVPFSLTRQCEPRACPRLCPGSAEAACRGLYLLMESRLWPSLRVQGQRGPAAQRLPTLDSPLGRSCPPPRIQTRWASEPSQR